MVCDNIAENLIKGIIVAHSRTGITIQQIAKLLRQCDEHWSMLNNGETEAIQYLQQIDGILSIENEKSERLWYVRGKTLNGEHCGQIYRANNRRELSDFDLSIDDPHGNAPSTCIQRNSIANTSNTNSNSNSNSNGYSNKNIHRTNRNSNGFNDINGNYVQRNNMQQMFYTNDRKRANGHGLGSPNNNDIVNSRGKTQAMLHDYNLVGDNFFMEMAKIDLGCSYTIQKNIQRSGLCISGQTIRDANERLKSIPNPRNMKIIANLGTVDILHGRDLSDMCQDYINLMKTCERRHIQIIITTLAPIANHLHVSDTQSKWRQFNEFLVKGFSFKTPVIDIVPSMVCNKTGKVLFDCYQPDAKYVTGSNKPHMLWNRIGRQRILKRIKAILPFH